eukprot:gene7728-8567_t
MPSDGMQLHEAISETKEALSLCLSNKFTEAQALLQPNADKSAYHALGSATICYLQAIMTYEPEAIQDAYKSVKKALEVCSRYRRSHTFTESLYSWVGKPYFQDYTEVEVHAELCYAECLLERAILTFIQDENLISFIKGGLKIKHAYNLYRSCLHIMSHCPPSMQSSSNRVDFEVGVHLGIGTFNLLLSLLPARILRLLEWVGFSGDKNLGLNHLGDGVKKDGIRSPLCAITMLGYRIVVGPILGLRELDPSYTKYVLDSSLEKFPEGAIFLYYAGRLEQVHGRFEEAIRKYQLAVSVTVDWKQVHHVCFWELMWSHSLQGKWTDAVKYANILTEESKWSKTAYLYFEGCFKLMEMFEKSNSLDWSHPSDEEPIIEIFRRVPEYKQRVAGKSIPFEKFAVYKADKYLTQNRRLVLPGLEAIYLWNGFSMCGYRKEVMEHFLKLIKTALADLDRLKDSNPFFIDEYCLCKLLQGMCLRYLDRPNEAEDCFQEVVDSGNHLKLDKYLAPYAYAEIGYLYRSLGKYKEAIKQLEKLRKRYSKYSLESRLHFRLHSNLEAMKEEGERQSDKDLSDADEDSFFDITDDLCPPALSEPTDESTNQGSYAVVSVGRETSV